MSPWALVDLIGRCANHRFTGKSLEDLRRLAAGIDATAKSTNLFEVAIRDVSRRLGGDTIAQLVLDHKDGRHTTELMVKYGISKSSVLRLLQDKVEMRRQGVSPPQAVAARMLYEKKLMSLAAVARELNLAKQSVRPALLELGVTMRPTGGSRGRDRQRHSRRA